MLFNLYGRLSIGEGEKSIGAALWASVSDPYRSSALNFDENESRKCRAELKLSLVQLFGAAPLNANISSHIHKWQEIFC